MTQIYLTTDEPNIRFEVIATVGDTLDTRDDGSDYRYVGIPDGLGAFDNGDGTFTILNSHELNSGSGIVRDHGSAGAFVSRLVVDKATLNVVSAEDAIKQVVLFDETTDSWVEQTTAFDRFCSSDLADQSAFFFNGLGTQDRIFLTGEESGADGRAFGVVLTGGEAGRAYELDFLGELSFENVVASPFAQEKTIVVGTDDATPGQVYVYVGEKQAAGNAVEKAGLTDGALYGIKVDGSVQDENAGGGQIVSGSSFSLVRLGDDTAGAPNGDVSDMTGAELQAQSDALAVTEFLRPEDAHWDPTNPNVLYLATTGTPARLIRFTFNDIANPEAGGTVDVLVDQTVDPVASLDNITVADDGKVYLQEDPGSSSRLAKVWVYDPASGTLAEVAELNADLFAPGAPNFITTNEESSGIIDVTDILGDGDTQAFLLDVQSHFNLADPELVQDGQLLAMFIDDPVLAGTNKNDDLFGSYEDEELVGGNGDDTAHAGGGNDDVFGGNGKDELFGGNGDDNIHGGNGKDVLAGEAGDDCLEGGNGKDWFLFDNTQETGNDVIKDFATGDLVLLTEELPGTVTVLEDNVLELFGSSTVEIEGVDKLGFAGMVEYDGVSYFAYELTTVAGNLLLIG